MKALQAEFVLRVAGYVALSSSVMCLWYMYQTQANKDKYPTPMEDFLNTTDDKQLSEAVRLAGRARANLAAEGLCIGLSTVMVGFYLGGKLKA